MKSGVCEYSKAIQWVLAGLKLFNILTAVADTPTHTGNKIVENDTHTQNTQVQIKLGESE